MDLEEIRKQLDIIDKEISKLYIDRITLCKDVANYKMSVGKSVFDETREAEKLQAEAAMTDDDYSSKALVELYKQIMTVSRRYQYTLMTDTDGAYPGGYEKIDELPKTGVKVVYQGVPGAYSHMATEGLFGKSINSYHVDSFDEAMTEVEEGRADYAMIPIENSTAGSVVDIYDLLMKHDLHIVSEYLQGISHELLGIPGAQLSDIMTVYSHPQGLMQCQQFLSEHKDIKQVSLANTAVAAKKVFADQDKSQAAIASPIAGEIYGLKSLKSDISSTDNTTRFEVLSRKKVYAKDASKISILCELPHKSGALYNILGNFIFNDINMVKIESRPISDRNWEYRFFIDIEGNLSDAKVRNALTGVSAEATMLRILGNY